MTAITITASTMTPRITTVVVLISSSPPSRKTPTYGGGTGTLWCQDRCCRQRRHSMSPARQLVPAPAGQRGRSSESANGAGGSDLRELIWRLQPEPDRGPSRAPWQGHLGTLHGAGRLDPDHEGGQVR